MKKQPKISKEVLALRHSKAYRKAYLDPEFLTSDELRPVRLQLELQKPEMTLAEYGVKSTVVCFGSARILDKKQSAARVTEMTALLKKHPEVQKITRSDARPMIELKPPTETQEEFKQAAAKENIPLPQALANATEQRQRAMVLDNNIALEKSETYKPQLKKAAPVPSAKSAEGQIVVSNDLGKDKKSDAPSGILAEVTSRYRSDSEAPSEREGAKSSTTRQSLPALAGDLQPVWVENELLLLRQATVEGSPRLQGVWLDWPQLQTRLLATIRDLMPAASLVAVQPEVARTDASSLVTLPVKLLTGPMAVSRVPLDSALRPALIIAWSCLVAAAIAIAFVLHRAMLLSERRGAFVSAVTH